MRREVWFRVAAALIITFGWVLAKATWRAHSSLPRLILTEVLVVCFTIALLAALWNFAQVVQQLRARRGLSRPTAEMLDLDQRFARGEISEHEYRQRRDALETKPR